MSTERRCWAEINLGALRHNAAVVRKKIGPCAGIMAIVKANAYGHGMAEVACELAGKTRGENAFDASVQMFGVANVAEACALREALAHSAFENFPGIFILGPALAHEREEIVRGGFVPAISTLEEAAAFDALSDGARVPVHLVIDTGMGRIGVWQEAALDTAKKIARLPNLAITGIATHFPVADEDENFTRTQLAHFEKLLAELRAAGIHAPLVHALNSAGVLRFARHAQNENAMVRAGLMLYGSSPIPDFQKELRAVMTLKTRVTLVRDFGAGRGVSYGRTFITPHPMRIATLAIGYADGFPRRLSNTGTEALLRGQRCAVLGRVTMDQIMIDVTHLPDVKPGEEVVLMGAQGQEEIFAADLAHKAQTIAWEIFTGIGPRVERVYV